MGYRRDAFRRGLAWMLRIVGGADREGGADKRSSRPWKQRGTGVWICYQADALRVRRAVNRARWRALMTRVSRAVLGGART